MDRPWDNPNIFGVMMAVGLVLAVGILVRSPNPKVESQGEGRVSGVEGGSLSKVQGWGGRAWKWLRFALWLGAAGVMGVGLVKSIAGGRGWGWRVRGVSGWQGMKAKVESRKRKPLTQKWKAESRKRKWAFPSPNPSPKEREGLPWVGRRRFGLKSVVSGPWSVVGRAREFGHLGGDRRGRVAGVFGIAQVEGAVARRAVSVANANDFRRGVGRRRGKGRCR